MSSLSTNAAVLTLLAAVSASSHGESNFKASDIQPYVGASVGTATYEEKFNGSTYETVHTTIGVRGGLKFNQFFSAEFRFGRGSEEAETVEGIYTTLDFESYSGLYARGHIPINDNLSIYGLLGKTKVKGTARAYSFGPGSSFFEVPMSESDTSFGFGAEYITNHTDKANFGLGLEYLQYADGDSVTLSGVSISALVQF
jgi:hypothetical protein